MVVASRMFCDANARPARKLHCSLTLVGLCVLRLCRTASTGKTLSRVLARNLTIVTDRDYCGLSNHFRELGDGGCDPPRFVAAEQLHDRSPPRVVLVIDKGQFLATGRLHHKAAREVLHQPRRLKIPAFRRGIIAGASGVTTDDKREQVCCFHLVNDKGAGLGDRGKRTTSPRPERSLERGVRAELRR
jgi:hypothetical protein